VRLFQEAVILEWRRMFRFAWGGEASFSIPESAKRVSPGDYGEAAASFLAAMPRRASIRQNLVFTTRFRCSLSRTGQYSKIHPPSPLFAQNTMVRTSNPSIYHVAKWQVRIMGR
jgi:hypothetical protein